MTRTDFIVVGSGIGGLCFALRAAHYGSVVLLTKKERPESSTNYAQGGIAAVFGRDDSNALHVGDTLVAGAGLCHRDAVEAIVAEGPARVRELIELGVEFTREHEALSLGREGGHSRRRIVRADDLTGREIERALLAAVATSPDICLLENHIAVDLLTAYDPRVDANRCCGVIALDPRTGAPTTFLSRAVLLATGGCGQIYRHTTNPAIATGDGIAMAFRAGARVANMEFVQFHPTALYPARGRSFLISEAVRGEGAVLRRIDGTSFMEQYHPLASLAPRDVVARAIDGEMKRSGDPHVVLDCSTIPAGEIQARFPNILRETAARGIDMLQAPLPVVPAAHYLCGGVLTDRDGRSSVAGLYVVGEAACSGVHGANRLASNSLLEALVMARRAADQAGGDLEAIDWIDPEIPDYPTTEPPERIVFVHDRDEIRSLMWDLVGIVRTDERLAMAEARVRQLAAQYEVLWTEFAPGPELVELRNMIHTSLLIVRCASGRKESRGLHYNADYPYRDNEHWLRDSVLVTG